MMKNVAFTWCLARTARISAVAGVGESSIVRYNRFAARLPRKAISGRCQAKERGSSAGRASQAARSASRSRPAIQRALRMGRELAGGQLALCGRFVDPLLGVFPQGFGAGADVAVA